MSTRLAVTGATGFVGRTLVPLLRDRGCDLLLLDRSDAASAPQAVVERLAAFAPSAVIHLATHFLSMHQPDDIPALVSANVEWGTVVAEAAANTGARLVNVGTAWQHYEGHDYDPVSLYASTKEAMAVIVDYYVRVRGLDACTVTLFDTYGPGDVRPKLVPLLLQAAATGTPLEMSDGEQLIDLTYVEDIAEGLHGVAVAPAPVPDCVLRSWTPVTVRTLVSTVASAIERPVPVTWDVRPTREREMRSDWVFGSSPDGWRARTSLEEGLRRTWIDGRLGGGGVA